MYSSLAAVMVYNTKYSARYQYSTLPHHDSLLKKISDIFAYSTYLLMMPAALTVRVFTVTWASIYTVSQKKTSPTFLAITRESIDGFL